MLLGKKQIQQVQQRLNLLLNRQWIGRNFSNLDRLTGRYASYYLLPKGVKILKQHDQKLDERLLHNIYKDKTASSRFIDHCLGVGDIQCQFRRLYIGHLGYLGRGGLSCYSYYPEPPPDIFFRLRDRVRPKAKPQEFLLEYCETIVPFFVYRKRIKQYGEYAEDRTWEEATGTKLPNILLVAETAVLQRRLQRFIKKWWQNSYMDELVFLVTNKELLISSKTDSAIWTEIGYEKNVLRSLE